MSYQKDRDQFIAKITAEGLPIDVARLLLRQATTLDRLAVAQCNGDYPCDNGERKTKPCSECELGYAPASLSSKGVCPECRAQHRVKTILKPFAGFAPIFGGDPRGAVLKLKVPSGKTDDWGQEGICVPTRNN